MNYITNTGAFESPKIYTIVTFNVPKLEIIGEKK